MARVCCGDRSRIPDAGYRKPANYLPFGRLTSGPIITFLRPPMKHAFIAGAFLLSSRILAAQVPEIRFDANVDFLKLPAGMYSGEVAGVAIDSRRTIFVFSRTGERSTCTARARVAAVRVRSRRDVHPRDRTEPVRVRVRAHRAHRQGRQHLGDRRRDEHDHQVQSRRESLMVLGRRAEAVEAPPPSRARASSRGRSGAASIVRPTSRGIPPATSSSPTATTTRAS